MDISTTSNNKVGAAEKTLLTPQLSLQDKRVTELLGRQPHSTCSPGLNAEKMGSLDDGRSFDATGAVSTSSSPLQDVARFALRAMEEISRIDPSFSISIKDYRKATASRPYDEGAPFHSMVDDRLLGPKERANGARLSESFHGQGGKEGMTTTNQSLGNEGGLFSHSIPGKRKRGRPAKTDLSRLNQSQNGKKRKVEEGALPLQVGVVDAAEGSSLDNLATGHNRGASVLKPISQNAPKRRGRPPKTRLAAPGGQPMVAETVPETTNEHLQAGLEVRAPDGLRGDDGSISRSGFDGFQESRGPNPPPAVGLTGGVCYATPEKSLLGQPVKKRGPGRPRKTERVLQSVEVRPEHFIRHEERAEIVLEAVAPAQKGELGHPREPESQQQPLLEIKAKGATPPAETPAKMGQVQLNGDSAHGAPLRWPDSTESVWMREVERPHLANVPVAPQTEQKTWTHDARAPDHPSQARNPWVSNNLESQSQEKGLVPDVATIVVKKRRGRPPKNKVAVPPI